MRIALRTSGGRGEYEMAGSQGDITLANVFNKRIILELVPGLLIDTGSELMRKDGKPRIRLVEKWGEHSYLTIASLLLLPKPIRELGKTIGGGRLQIRDSTFSITVINFAISKLTNEKITIRPTEIILQNYENISSKIDFAERLQLVFSLWDVVKNSSTKTADINNYILTHEQSVLTGNLKELEKSANGIRKYTHSENDPLRQMLHDFGISGDNTYTMGIHPEFAEVPEDDDRSSDEIKSEIIKKWRLLAVRGAGGERFRRLVHEAYGSKCIFTGSYLPSTILNPLPGVDAAHILPWSIHNINKVQNGICLNKLCHWAFDSGILRMNFDSKSNQYTVNVPDNFIDLHRENKIDLSYFIKIQGAIPRDNLPFNQDLWPSPEFINKFNETW
ncbi:MAG: HNH endonuclease signature motif containing protein [Saprospiraceae bacterium]|nr:HNH endonuclease [Saprospiraceae bacterium]